MALSSREAELDWVVRLVEELVTGSRVSSQDTDVLRADQLPSVLTTGELDDL